MLICSFCEITGSVLDYPVPHKSNHRKLLATNKTTPYDNMTSLIYVTNGIQGAGRSSEVGRSLMVRWIVGSILHGGPSELFLVPASAPHLVQQRPWFVLSCLWDGAYKRTLAANRKE